MMDNIKLQPKETSTQLTLKVGCITIEVLFPFYFRNATVFDRVKLSTNLRKQESKR